MKPLTIGLILIICIYNVNAQTNNTATAKAPDPQFLNHVYFYHADSLASLEQIEARYKSKPKGFGGNETGFEMNGEKSPVRIKAGDTIRFAVKMNGMMSDPTTMIKLYHFDSRKGNREAIMNSQSSMYSKAKEPENTIAFNVQKSGNDVFIIMPASALGTGEYGFLNMMLMNGGGMKMSYTVFAFGVDP
ncbi:MAG TPA: hypothetical protein VMH01_15690 [Puia sp.]|nr:hypothetical protein [Puia sp.]